MYTKCTILLKKRKIYIIVTQLTLPDIVLEIYREYTVNVTKYRTEDKSRRFLEWKKILSFQSYNSSYQFEYATMSLNFFEKGSYEIYSIILF